MLRSLRSRLLAVSLAVAVVSIAATAWLTSSSTTDRLKGDFQRTLETDGFIYNELVSYAQSHRDWRAVHPTVASLSRQTGRRIAIKLPKGPVVADSAILLGQGHHPLPQQPAAVVDALNPVIGFYGTSTANPPPGPPKPTYPYTPAELANRAAQADKVQRCLDQSSVSYRRTTDDQGLPAFNINVRDQAATSIYQKCVGNRPLDAPSQGEVDAANKDAQATIACLDLRGVHHDDSTDEVGTIQIDVGNSRAASDALTTCGQQVTNATLAPLVAKRVFLYLGQKSGGGLTLLQSSTARTLTAAAIIMVLAVAVTVVASRRILAPVVALTAAARRLQSGDHTLRVSVKGRDELGQLGSAFNAMASALQETDELRRGLVSDIAHELRTPLSNIVGYVEAAEDGIVPLNPELLASLHEEAALLRGLVDDLQDMALADAGQLRLQKGAVDLTELAEQVVAASRQRASAAEVALRFEAWARPIVAGDAQRLRQVLGNLVANAITHTEAGGQVLVRIEEHDQQAEVLVIDNGVGIAPEHLAHVFDRFYRADASRSRDTGGSGLGLAISQQLVSAHGGTIEVASKPGQGSTFTVRLPLQEALSEPARVEEPTPTVI
jgi:two-component system sensor histidine kinase BaeS